MAGLLDDLGIGATWMAAALSSSGYRADFTPASLWEIERFLDEQTLHGRPRPGGLLADDLGRRVFGLGAYVGEVIRRAREGAWQVDDADPNGELDVAVTFGTTTAWPVQRVMKRIQLGYEDGDLVGYAIALGLDVGSRPSRREPTPPADRWAGRPPSSGRRRSRRRLDDQE